jgi:hypothetical protein
MVTECRLTYLRELVACRADGFDWPAQQAELARLPRREETRPTAEPGRR